MKNKPSPMMMAIANVKKIPPKKEPKGNQISPGGSYYYPPTLYLSDEDYPGVADLKPKQEVQLLITAKVTNWSSNQDEKGKARTNVTLDITSIGEAKQGGAK